MSPRRFLRASGTEPLIRVMAEGDQKLMRSVVDEISAAIAGRTSAEKVSKAAAS